MPWCLCNNKNFKNLAAHELSVNSPGFFLPSLPPQSTFNLWYIHTVGNHHAFYTHTVVVNMWCMHAWLDSYCHHECTSILHSQRGCYHWKRSLSVLSVRLDPNKFNNNQTDHNVLLIGVTMCDPHSGWCRWLLREGKVSLIVSQHPFREVCLLPISSSLELRKNSNYTWLQIPDDVLRQFTQIPYSARVCGGYSPL